MMPNFAKPLSVSPPLELLDSAAGSLLRITSQSIEAQITADNGDGSYSWEEIETGGDGDWTAVTGGRTSGTDTGDGEPNPAYERSGNDVPVDAIVTLQPGYDGEYWLDYVTTVPDLIAKITGPGVSCGSSDPNAWAWTEQVPVDSACGTYSDGSRTGTLGCQPTISILTAGDGSSTAMSWSVSFSPALRKGDWKLKLDTTTSTTFNESTTASDIDTAFSPNTSTTGSVSAGFTITDVSDFNAHTLTWAGGSTLIPPPSTPAFEMNGVLDFGYPCLVELKKGGGTDGKLTLSKTSTGDSPTDTIHTVFTVTTNSATQDGNIVFTVDGGTPTSNLKPDITSSDLETALGGSGVCTVTGSSMGSTYTITFAGYDDHTLTVSSVLVGTTWYRFLAPLTEPTDGTCISTINGVALTAIPAGDPTHWTGGATPVVLTIDPFSGCLVYMPTEACEPFVGGE